MPVLHNGSVKQFLCVQIDLWSQGQERERCPWGVGCTRNCVPSQDLPAELRGTLGNQEPLAMSCLGKLPDAPVLHKDYTFILRAFFPCVCTLCFAGSVLLSAQKSLWGNAADYVQPQLKFWYMSIAHLISNPCYTSCLQHSSNALHNQNWFYL